MNNEQLETMLVDLIGKVGKLIEGQARIEERLERIESKIERLERKILFHTERIESRSGKKWTRHWNDSKMMSTKYWNGRFPPHIPPILHIGR